MVIAGILAVIVGIIGIVGRFQLTDEMSKIGMDVCIIAAVVAMVYKLTARRKLHMEFVKLKKKKVYLQSQQEKLKSVKKILMEFTVRNGLLYEFAERISGI